MFLFAGDIRNDMPVILEVLNVSRSRHNFKGVFTTKDILIEEEYFVTGTQLNDETQQYLDTLVNHTYASCQYATSWVQKDIFSGLSSFVQAVQQVFYFRPILSSPDHFLEDPEEYGLVQAFLRSGREVANTWYGRVVFDPDTGQNIGRNPPTLQLHDDMWKAVFPISIASHALQYPSHASETCNGFKHID